MSNREFREVGASAPGGESALEGTGSPARSPRDARACPRAHGPAAEAFQEFSSAFLRAVAMSWVDPSKLDFLKRDPRRFLSVLCGYELPRNITLIVGEARESRGAERRPAGWDVLRQSWDRPDVEVVLDVPHRPTLEEQAVALAEFGAGGGRFAIVCC